MKIKQLLTRVYVNDLNFAVEFYEGLLSMKCSMRFDYPDVGLELAQIDTLLILAGSEKALEPFRKTVFSIIVDSLTDYKEFLIEKGATILADIKKAPSGFNMRIRHTDGVVVEYIEHTANTKS